MADSKDTAPADPTSPGAYWPKPAKSPVKTSKTAAKPSKKAEKSAANEIFYPTKSAEPEILLTGKRVRILKSYEDLPDYTSSPDVTPQPKKKVGRLSKEATA